MSECPVGRFVPGVVVVSFFKKWFRRTDPAPDAVPPQATVPPDHTVRISFSEALPRLQRCQGGLLLAHLGVGGDDQPGDIAALVEEVVAEEAAPVLLASAGRLSELFAPGNPAVTPLRGGVLWTAMSGGLRGMTESRARIDALLGHFERVGAVHGRQWLVLSDRDLQNAGPTIALLGGVGVPVCAPASDGSVLVEVARPDGVVLSALTGAPITAGAAGMDDIVSVAVAPPPDPPLRDGALRRALLAVHRQPQEPAGWIALCGVLLARKAPLLLLGGPGRQLAMMTFPGGIRGLPVYGDLLSLKQTAADTGAGDRAPVGLSIQDLARMALEQNTPLFFNVFADLNSPLYVRPGSAVLGALAAGRLPSAFELRPPEGSH